MFGGVFDEEFRESSIWLFDQVKRGEVVCLYSEIVENELVNAPSHVKTFFEEISREYLENLEIIPVANKLAGRYISENVVGITSIDDCLHIALATIYNADILISWNFKHIVNSGRIRGYNTVNLKSGYKELKIVSPKELLSNERRVSSSN